MQFLRKCLPLVFFMLCLPVHGQDEAADIAAVKLLLANGEAAFNACNLALGVHNNHIHIFKRQADGQWKTWRMMTNAVTAEE